MEIDKFDEFTQFCLKSERFKHILALVSFDNEPTKYHIGLTLKSHNEAVKWFNENREEIMLWESGEHPTVKLFDGFKKQFLKTAERSFLSLWDKLISEIGNPKNETKNTAQTKIVFRGIEVMDTMSGI